MSNRAAILRCCLVGALLIASAVPARGISVRSSSWHMPVVGNLLVSEGLVSAAAARGAARFSSKGPRADVPGMTRRRLDDCGNDDSTEDEWGDTCTDWYDDNPDGCGDYDDTDFTASEQCCACGGGLAGGTFAPTGASCGAYSVSGAQYQTTRMGTYVASGECDGKTPVSYTHLTLPTKA